MYLGICALACSGLWSEQMIPDHLYPERIRLDPLKSSRSHWYDDKTRLMTVAGLALFLMESLTYLELGQHNADEGWYLYSSRLVFQGLLPFRDFAYTQMPLFSYVYGVPQILSASVLLGRLTSLLLSIGILGMSVVIARRYAGAWGGALTALLFAAFNLGIYFDTVVKTYVLVAFFFTGTLFVLSSDTRDTYKYPLAVLFALAAAFVRVTAGFFAAPVYVYAFLRATRPTRVVLVIEGAAAAVLTGFFLLPNWTAARWGLFSSHLRHWGNLSTLERLNVILTERVPDIIQTFGPLLMLVAASLCLLAFKDDPRQRDTRSLLAPIAGILLFAGSHLLNGIWGTEYLVPAVSSLLPILAIALARLHSSTPRATRPFEWGILIAVLALLALGEGTQHMEWSGRRLPLAEVDQVAALIKANSEPTDRVLALEGLAAVYEADRQVLPGLTLAEFSVQNFDTATAEQLRVVTTDTLVDAVRGKTARLVVLTDGDWGVLDGMPSGREAFQSALDESYRLVFTLPDFGEFDRTIQIYAPRVMGSVPAD